MCTYLSERIILRASGKTPEGWATMTEAVVYFDHPTHFPQVHALIIDVLNPKKGPSTRVVLEMDAQSARDLAAAIIRTLGSAHSESG
jgi:hypothetical protein